MGVHEQPDLVRPAAQAVVEARVGDGGRARVGEQRGEFEVVLLERRVRRAHEPDRVAGAQARRVQDRRASIARGPRGGEGKKSFAPSAYLPAA